MLILRYQLDSLNFISSPDSLILKSCESLQGTTKLSLSLRNNTCFLIIYFYFCIYLEKFFKEYNLLNQLIDLQKMRNLSHHVSYGTWLLLDSIDEEILSSIAIKAICGLWTICILPSNEEEDEVSSHMTTKAFTLVFGFSGGATSFPLPFFNLEC